MPTEMNGRAIGITKKEANNLDLDELTGYKFIYEKPEFADYGYGNQTALKQEHSPNGKIQNRRDITQSKQKSKSVENSSPLDEKLNAFARRTTAHGWGQVANERWKILKLFWVVITLGAYLGNGWHVSLLVQQYLKYPTEQVSRVQFTSIEFPSITLCNIQPMSFSTGLNILNDRSSKLFYWTNLTDTYFQERNAAHFNFTSAEYEYMFNRLRQPVGYFENIGDESIQVGHRLSDFILRCTFAGSICSESNFSFYQSPSYFNCYTFNGGNISVNKLIAKTTGPQQGLSLILYLEMDNGDQLHNGTYHTLSNIGNAAGVRVVIHSPDSLPTPVDTGFDIPPGYSSSVGIHVEKAERLVPPYGECRQNLKLSFSDRFVYSQLGCLLLCQQRLIIEYCQCISSLLPIPPDNIQYRFCGYFNISDPQFFFDNLSCEANVMNNFASNNNLQNNCGCYPPCEEKTYKTDVSYAYWPLDFAQHDFYRKYVLEHPQRDTIKAYTNLIHFNITDLIQSGLIRRNFVRLNIYLKDLIVAEIVQKRTYELQNLFSDMGGTFGLWIGVSILSWFEIFEFFMKLMGSCCRRFWKKIHPDHGNAVEPSDSNVCSNPTQDTHTIG